MLLLVSLNAMAQDSNFTVTGVVTSLQDNMPLPGVSVVLKGTNKGVITDFDGRYSIDVSNKNSVLAFYSLGFEVREIIVENQRTLNVALAESTESLDEVVVTALGIKREDKSLGYSVEKVKAEEVTRVAQENVLNSLSGKVSGVTINATGGTGSSVSMVIRGATSLSTDNQPLFVVDGVPIGNSVNNVGGFGDSNTVDYGNAISDLDPQSIESVSILKGPSAAALYGTRAGNGVVLITTKKAKDKEKMKVSFSSDIVYEVPYNFLNVQSQFASGVISYSPRSQGGSYIMPDVIPNGGNSGPELDKGYYAVQWNSPLDANGVPIPTELVSYSKNPENFFQTGITKTNSVSVTNSSEFINYRLGLSAMDNTGIIPNSDLKRNNFSLSASSSLSNTLTFSSNANLVHSYSDNRPSTGRNANPLDALYSIPANINVLDLKNYKLPGNEVFNFSDDYSNPYFLAHEINNSFSRYRIFGNVALDWQVSPSFSMTTSYNLNKTNETRETKMAPGYQNESHNGTYGIAKTDGLETNIDFLATYIKDFGDYFDMTISAGGNLMYQKSNSLSNSAKNGVGLIVPNLFRVNNIAPTALNYSSSTSERAVNSVYALANFGFKDMLFLDLTARNDWSSTLPVENRSYFYPSASLSFLVNEVIDIPSVNLLKLRGGWAQVGNDTGAYQLETYYSSAGQWGDASMYSAPSGLNTPSLKPEEAVSKEFGLDLMMFNRKLRFEGTYYTVENKNQIINNIPIAGSSGYTSVSINAGILESKGLEFSLGLTPVKTKNWNLDLDFNYTTNESKIKKLSDGVDYIEFWSEGKAKSRGYVANAEMGQDGLVGNIYGRKMQRVTDVNSPYYMYPIIEEGEDAEWIVQENYSKIGNYNPDFIMGLQTRLSYKNLTLNLTFDWRSGGQYVSDTSRRLADEGISQDLLNNLVNPGISGAGPELRQWVLDHADQFIYGENFQYIGGTPGNGGFEENLFGPTAYDGVFAAGVVGSYDNDGNFILKQENLGNAGTQFMPFAGANPWQFASPHLHDADYIKLREVSLSYDLPKKYLDQTKLEKLTFSIYTRNIMLWAKDASFGIDPERAFQASGGTFKQGTETYNVTPWTLPIGFKVGITF
ncbi:SusC/RagA family TonB-linked outer membrane protein [Confluentibacter sediminis]|uniref:SusC/RagA family TonB-linked outer membrane protein n=1 Tax=Confluentibacter sediminis TaxID=2219045 RepID=UPI001C738666|nr:SusC/RagA family TonB-linked outer membrane protein [Confluentibacter sediminis]